jgi:DNA-binding transcriptional MerR regulator
MFKTSELARLLGVERSFLHYYDRAGIISPQKDENRFRNYSENDLIALASSKYYRAMGMKLDELKDIIHTSGIEEKMAEMSQIQDHLRERINYLQDVYVVTEYAKTAYQLAYRSEPLSVGEASAFDFVPLVTRGVIDRDLLNDEKTQNLLQEFPFVAYAYYFPKGSLLKEEDFICQLGLSVITEIAEKRGIQRPAKTVRSGNGSCVIYNVVKLIDQQSFKYEDFEELRTYAAENKIRLTGEAIAYCVFTNYGYDKGKIRFVLQALSGS